MSLFSALSLGYSGLAASQLHMDVTGQNITNANTEGYSRKRVDVSSDARKDPILGELGIGVSIDKVERVKNEFIDIQLAKEKSQLGYYETIDSALERIENIFTEPSDTALNSFLDDFWNSWQDLANNPSDLSARAAVKTTAEVLCAQFNAVGEQLVDYKMSINTTIEDQVRMLNHLTSEISALNDEIANIELTEKRLANDSRDARDLKVQELSKLIEVSYQEDDDGRLTVTTGGNIIVGPREVVPIEIFKRQEEQADGTIISTNYLRYSGTKKEYMPLTGEMRGLFDIRDNEIDSYIDSLNTMVDALVKEVNGMHYTGYDLDTDTGIYFFDPNKLTATTISVGADIKDDVRNIAAAKGGNIETPFGAPLPGTVPAGSRSIDVTDGSVDPLYNPRYQNIVPGTMQIFLGGVQLDEGAGKDYTVDYNTGQIFFTNPTTVPDGSAVTIEFEYNDSTFAGVGDGSNALDIAQIKEALITKPNAAGDDTQTVGEFYSAFIGDLGIKRNQAASNFETRQYIVEQLTQTQQEVSGVSLDEEMANMIKFEHTYQASARYISVINEMMDVLLNL